eukprot:m.198885 g.198885  ORF g.198885 m.198885 type:complete len:328 (+) comp13691_c0_seq7:428-1411(+)
MNVLISSHFVVLFSCKRLINGQLHFYYYHCISELEALEAIYEDEIEWPTKDESLFSQSNIHTLTIAISPEFNLKLLLPHDYPLLSAPIVELDKRWRNRESDLVRISSLLDETFEPGFGIIAEWVESLRELLNAIESEQEDEKRRKRQEQQDLDVALASSVELEQSMESLVLNGNGNCVEDSIGITIQSNESFTDRKSTFQGHVAEVHSHDDVKLMMSKLLQNNKIAKATHNMLAYRIRDNTTESYMQDCDDDGEHGASSRMLHLLNVLGVENVAVVVTRWYGGIHLGPDRFKHINNCTRDVLVKFGYHSDKEDAKKKKSKKKKPNIK